MAESTRDVRIATTPQHAYGLALASGMQISGFSLFKEDPQGYSMWFKRGFGWSNPIDMYVWIYQSDPNSPSECTVHYKASILALADPFGFTKGAIDLFEKHLQAHLQAAQTGAPIPPPPKDMRAMKVNFAIIGIVMAIVVGLALVMIVAIVVGG